MAHGIQPTERKKGCRKLLKQPPKTKKNEVMKNIKLGQTS
jgi:hypothetical protein